jgi:purine nucleoside phosphorylase
MLIIIEIMFLEILPNMVIITGSGLYNKTCMNVLKSFEVRYRKKTNWSVKSRKMVLAAIFGVHNSG